MLTSSGVSRTVRAQIRPAPVQQLAGRPLARRAVASRAAASSIGQPSEPAALAAFTAAHPANIDSCLELLTKAATTKAVAPELVEGALVWLEQNSKPGSVSSVDGTWRLVYSTSTSIRFWQYIPVKEDLCVDTAKGTISLESEVGPFQFIIGGNIGGWRSASGELDFQFKTVDILLGGNKIWTVVPKGTKPKTYTFYFEGGRISAARSSAGGLSLLLK